jgi:glycosyltransferase involved in cell wall biosynthesis
MSGGIRQKLIDYFGYPPNRISVHHHGVDTERFKPSPEKRCEFRKANGIPDDAVVIVSHGRLHPVKRVDRILGAFEALASKHENVWLLLTAYGPLKEEVEALVASKGIFRRVKLLGFQNDPTIVLKASDIYVLASDNEGFGIALVEAMSTGMVCVATNTSGPGEILSDGVDGFLVDVSDEAVRNGLERALELTLEQAVTMKRNARKTSTEKFEINSAVNKVLQSLEIPGH